MDSPSAEPEIRYARDDRSGIPWLIGCIRGWFWAVVLIGSLLGVNVVQCASFVFMPISRWLVWKINRECAQAWWSWVVLWTERRLKVRIEVTGDEIPFGETAFMISNHQQMADIPIVMSLALPRGRLGDLKWFVKDPIKYVPGIGWGLLCLGCIFLKRNWYADQARIRRTFSRLLGLGVPFWLVSFVEGTRITPGKLARARKFAQSKGLRPPVHTLIPRLKGFSSTVASLASRLDAVYDVTVYYEDGIPTLWQFAKGLTHHVRMHVRRYPIASLPATEEGLGEWLRERYEEKDALLESWLNERR